MKQTAHLNREQLDQLAVTVEFTVLSIIQGVVLSILVTSSIDPLMTGQWQYWPYIISGLSLIIFFWASSVAHALSFVKWPLDLVHTSLYFVIAFIQMMALSQLENPTHWYLYNMIFFILGGIIYWIDLPLIKRRENDYDSAVGKQLYQDMIEEQQRGLRVFVPLGIISNFIAWQLIRLYPEAMLANQFHVVISVIQAIVGLASAYYAMISFQERSRLIGELADE